MATPLPKRSVSDPPPPITVEVTAATDTPQPVSNPYMATPRPGAGPSSASKSQRQTTSQKENQNPNVRRSATWSNHRRKHSPGVEWHEQWTSESWSDGRVLLIDYVSRDHAPNGRRKIVAQEFSNLHGLKKFYANQDLSEQAALRVIHVQNASWATKFFLKKYNIISSNDLVGTSFARWARYERPQMRGGKPVLNGKAFRMQRDPWRGITRASFGCDYLRHYDRRKFGDPADMPAKGAKVGAKMMELNGYDAADNPCYAYDVFVQRLSVYIQRSVDEPFLPAEVDVKNPYDEEEFEEYYRMREKYGSPTDDRKGHRKYVPKLSTLDNGNTIIIFEHSHSGSVNDTLIGAREEIESRWRRLTFYLRREEAQNDERLAVECMDFILRDIFKALAFGWERFIKICETHIGILETDIYENPADETRAPELWTNANYWLKVERLMYLQLDIVKEMRTHVAELTEEAHPRPQELWLGNAPDELEKLTTQFQEGVIKPTTNLSDLLYKSVGIRDARHSLQLGLSMWRLSWITFIFLPLTFMSGFFGMNVDVFKNDPSIKWWFIISIPLMVVVVALWYAVKHTLDSQRQIPLRRTVYEALYRELATQNPSLWSQRGPREGIIANGWYSSLRWRLMNQWYAPERTVLAKQAYDTGDQDLGVWSRTKRFLARKWITDIQILPSSVPMGEADLAKLDPDFADDLGAVRELISLATPVALADAEPTAASRFKNIPIERLRSLSPSGSSRMRPGSGGTTGDGTSSGVMVEEKGVSEDERSVGSGEDDAPVGEEGRSSSFEHRLRVPFSSSK